MIGIVSRNPRSWCSQQLHKALADLGSDPVFLRFRDFAAFIGLQPHVLVDGIDAERLAAIIVRPIGRRSFEEILFRMDVLHKLARTGLPVINHPSAIEKCADKYHALSLLEENGVPVPKTVVTENVGEALRVFREFNADAVVKPLFGSRGHGITRIVDEDVGGTVFRSLRFARRVLYVQEFVPHGIRDIRAFVLGDGVIAAMYREGSSWKTNISRGARPKPLEPTKEIEELALKAAGIVGCELAGVDIMEGPSGPVVCEVNSQPSWKGLQLVTAVKIADEIARYVIQRSKG